MCIFSLSKSLLIQIMQTMCVGHVFEHHHLCPLISSQLLLWYRKQNARSQFSAPDVHTYFLQSHLHVGCREEITAVGEREGGLGVEMSFKCRRTPLFVNSLLIICQGSMLKGQKIKCLASYAPVKPVLSPSSTGQSLQPHLYHRNRCQCLYSGRVPVPTLILPLGLFLDSAVCLRVSEKNFGIGRFGSWLWYMEKADPFALPLLLFFSIHTFFTIDIIASYEQIGQ